MKNRILLFILISTINICYGQTNIKFEHLTTQTGLSENSVSCMIKDHLGYLWIGTAKGLVRYDGNEYKVFKNIEKDSTSLSGSRVLTLFEDKDGIMWIGVDGNIGLNSYDFKTEKFRQYKMDKKDPYFILSNSVLEIFQSSDGLLWFGGWDGIRILDKTKNKFIYHVQNEKNPKAISAKGVFEVIEDNNKKVWILTFGKDASVYRKETNDFERVPIELDGTYWKKVVKDKDGLFNIICYGCGLIKYDPIKRVIVDKIKPNNLFSCCYRGGFFAPDGYLWLGSDGFGITILDPITKNFQTIKNNPNNKASLSENLISDIYRDKEGMVWASTWNKGVNYYDPNRYKFYLYENIAGSENYFSNKSIIALFEDSKKRLWLGTEGDGLWIFDQKVNNFNKIELTKDFNSISSLCEDRNGNLLITSLSQGFAVYNPETKNFKLFKPDLDSPNHLHGSVVNKIIKTKGGRIFLVYNHNNRINVSIQEFDDKKQEFKNDKLVDVNSSNILTIYEDSNGLLWMGTHGQGVFTLDLSTGKYTKIAPIEKESNSLSNVEIVTIFEDKNNNMWFGSECCGLDCFNPKTKKWIHFSESDGLLSDIVHGILEDKNGNLWISTSKGLQKFDPLKKTFVNYDNENGLQVGSFNKNCALQTSDGMFYFGGTMGLNSFKPESIKNSTYSPNINITNLLISNQEVFPDDKTGILKQPISQTKKIILSYKYNMFSLTYSGMVFSNQQHVRYAYKLEGFNKDWVEAGKERKVTYTNLDAGKYTFKVKTTNNDGVWGQKEASLIIVIVPPFWKTWWFKLLVISFCILILLRYYIYRVNLIKNRNKELEILVSQRTKELKGANNILIVKNDEILQQKEEIIAINDSLEKQHNQLERAYNNMTLVSEFGQKIASTLNFVNISNMILEYVNNIIEIDSISIGVYLSKEHAIWWKYKNVSGETIAGSLDPLSKIKNVATYCFENNKVVILPENYDELKAYLSTEQLQKYISKTIICIPLIIENKVFGIFRLERNSLDLFQNEDISTLKNIAQYVSFALDNAEAYEIVTHKNDQIRGSIKYAQTIQNAILPKKENIDKYFESFILYQPKDIVSGDFYWFTELTYDGVEYLFLAVIDCTGHGVPGAFMSMIGNRCLNEIVNEKNIIEPSEIFNLLNSQIQMALRQREKENNDGMEISLFRFKKQEIGYKVRFSSSKMKAFFYKVSEKRVEILKGDRFIIGGQQSILNPGKFTQIEFDFLPDDCIYLSSDGIIDQNDENRIRFGSQKLKNIFENNANQAMNFQKEILQSELDNYKKNTHQRDDITVIGIKIKNT